MESINDVGCGRRLIADIAATTALPLAFVHAIEFVNTTKRNGNVRQLLGASCSNTKCLLSNSRFQRPGHSSRVINVVYFN